jgi:MoxR-like ATPase
MSIPFKGHYDGDGHAVIYKRDGGEVAALFSAIEPQSSIANLALENLRLAVEAEGCQIARCKSNIGLIAEQARGCDISDCIVTVDLDYEARRMLFAIYGNNYYELGGIARYLSDDCTVERCFVSGAVRKSGDMETRFSGIAPACSDGSIRQCAVGKLTLSGDGLKWGARIASHQGAGMLENNVALDSQSARKDGNGNDGKSVAPALFKQAYFEHNLDWDFDTVWQWDGQHDRPALRACAPAPVQASSGGAMTDLLTQQIRANIWL